MTVALIDASGLGVQVCFLQVAGRCGIVLEGSTLFRPMRLVNRDRQAWMFEDRSRSCWRSDNSTSAVFTFRPGQGCVQLQTSRQITFIVPVRMLWMKGFRATRSVMRVSQFRNIKSSGCSKKSLSYDHSWVILRNLVRCTLICFFLEEFFR